MFWDLLCGVCFSWHVIGSCIYVKVYYIKYIILFDLKLIIKPRRQVHWKQVIIRMKKKSYLMFFDKDKLNNYRVNIYIKL